MKAAGSEAASSSSQVQENVGGQDSALIVDSQKSRRGFSPAVLQEFILESLSFKSMNFREQDIEEAHGSSFDWIFKDKLDDEHPSFSNWLSTAELGNVYWSKFI